MLLIFFLFARISSVSDISRVINFCFKIAFDKEKKAVDVQTIGNGKREEIILPTWINVPLDVSISFRYLFSDARTEQFLSGIHKERKKEEIEIEQSGQKN